MKLALTISILFGSLTCSIFAQQKYTLNGKFPAKTNALKIYAAHRLGDEFVRDSATITNGRFTLNGTLEEPGLLYLSVKRKDTKITRGDMLQVFVEPGTFNLRATDSLKTAKVLGSAAYTDYKLMESFAKPGNDQIEAYYAEYDIAYKAKDKSKMEALDLKIEEVQKGPLFEAYKNFIVKNPQSPVALTALERMAGYEIDYEKVNPIWQQIDATAKNSKSGMAFMQKLEIALKTKIGAPAIAFTQNDTSGKAVSLSDFKGKYVLVDFWASWCGPCRAENPNVVKNFNEYKNKNFTVLGISLDRENQKDKWLKAIADDQLNWTHISDLKFWKNEVALLYGIQAIPQNLLIDPNGIIIGKNLREDRLGQKLKELLGDK